MNLVTTKSHEENTSKLIDALVDNIGLYIHVDTLEDDLNPNEPINHGISV